MANYKVSKLRPLGKKVFGFNVYIEADGLGIQINGFRVMNGRICAPAITYGQGRYYTAALLPTSVAEALYSDLARELPDGALKPVEEAIKYAVVTEDSISKFMTGGEANG